MHVLVIGGAGFIGSHLVEYHLKLNHHVYVVDDLSTGSMDNLAPFLQHEKFKYEIADILVWPGVKDAVLWADRIYHMAAVIGMFRVLAQPIETLATNIVGYERVLRAIAEHPKNPQVLIASSSSVYGANTNQPHQEDDMLMYQSSSQGYWGYAISKLVNEAYSHAYARMKGARITMVRLFNNIGPRQVGTYGMVVPRFVQQAVMGEPITVFGDGEQTRSFCDVRDTVAMFELLMQEKRALNQVVNVGHDREISMHQLAVLVKQIAESDSPIQLLSYQEAYGEAFEDRRRRLPCLKRLQSLITYQYQWSLEDTIRDLVSRERAKQ